MHLHFQVQALIISSRNILAQLIPTLRGGQRSLIRDDQLSCGFVLFHFHQYLTFAGFLHRICGRDVTSKISDPFFVNFD